MRPAARTGRDKGGQVIAAGEQGALPGARLARDTAVAALHAATALYTAEPIVDALLEAVRWPGGGRRLVDPSCGDGAFLARAVELLLRQQPGAGPDDVVAALEGWEVHPGAARDARARLERLFLGAGWGAAGAAATAARVVRTGDFLTEGPTEPVYDVVAGNPPYLRFLNVPELLRAEYEAVLPAHACGDLLHSFLDRCALTLRAGGEVALVTADRWLFNQGASRLREALGRRLALHEVRRLDAATAFYRPKSRRAGTPPRVHPVAVILRGAGEGGVRLTGAPVYPDQLGTEQEGGARLGEVAKVSLAPWLGAEGVFVVDAATAARLPREHLVPAVDTDDIRDGKLREPRRFAIRTRPDVEPPATILGHLDGTLDRITPRGRRNTRWLPPETWHGRDLSAPCLLVPRIARSLKPVRLPAGVLAINHNISIVSAGQASLDEIEAVLRSPEAEAWARAHAAPLENGYYSLTTTLLRRLPFHRGGRDGGVVG